MFNTCPIVALSTHLILFLPDSLLLRSTTSIPVGKGTVAFVAVLFKVSLIDGVKVGGREGISAVSSDVLPGGTDDVPNATESTESKEGSSSAFADFLPFAFFGVALPPTFSGEML